MDILEAIEKYKASYEKNPEPIPKETLEKLLEAARLSPSAKNIQPWHFIVVTNEKKRKALSNDIFGEFLGKVPAVIVACGNPKASPDWYVIDVALAGENIVLAASTENLDVKWVGNFNEDKIKKLLKIPPYWKIVGLLAIGKIYEEKGVRKRITQFIQRRKTLQDIASFEVYGQKFK